MINKILGKLHRKSSSKSSANSHANYHINKNGEPFNTYSSVNSNSFSYGVTVDDYNSRGSSNSFVYSGNCNELSRFSSGYGTYAPMNSKKLGTMDVKKVDTAGGLGYETLPSFREVPSSEKVDLFMRKLNLCCVVFDFSDPAKNLKEKDVKRQTLLELVDFVTTANLRFNEVVMQEITKMLSANLFRTLRVLSNDSSLLSNTYDPEQDEPLMDPSWPHLQVVYEFLLRFLSSSEMDAKLVKRYVDHSFVLRLLDLFDSEDQREREYLKTILHRIYGKFMVHRPFIRKAINNILYHFIFETEKHNGIAELLEILGSIINGFALPLKEEHKLFLVRVLIPLHKPKCEPVYHQQLAHCITQFVEKDFKLADTVIRGLLKYWPITNSSKEIMFLGELEEVLEVIHAAEFQCCLVPLFRQIGRCVNSSHVQVAECALSLWNNDPIRNLILQNQAVILPIILPSLERNSRGHWNLAVQSLTLNVMKVFSDADGELFDECSVKLREDETKEEGVHKKRQLRWKQLEYVATSNAVSNQAVLQCLY